jgi:hypothetical protein
VCCHTAEGALTYQSLGNFFASPSAGVSSQAGIDDTPGTIGVYVKRGDKAWTQGNANPYTVSAELCAFAGWGPGEWQAHPQMLRNTADWIAEECAAFGIPITRLSAAQAQGGEAGVCMHVDLGAEGGGHWDCGPDFPMDQVLDMARGGAGAGPAPARRRSRKMFASTDTGEGYWTSTEDGAIYAFGDAIYRGSPFDDKDTAGSADRIQPGQSVVSIEGHGTDGYWLLITDGSVFAYGSAPYKGRPDRV